MYTTPYILTLNRLYSSLSRSVTLYGIPYILLVEIDSSTYTSTFQKSKSQVQVKQVFVHLHEDGEGTFQGFA